MERRRAGPKGLAAALMLWLALLATALAAPAVAHSGGRSLDILRDAETEALFRDLADPLAEAAGLDPRSIQILLLRDSSINAFATTGQRIFFHSGLLIAAEDVNEFQGVLAHELGHIAGGHMVRFGEGAQPASNISLLSMVLGAAAIAMGAPDAGMAVMMAGQRAALGSFLAFSREQEARTDQAAAQFLERAGVSGRGMLSFFRRLQGDEFRLAIPQDNEYIRSHPLTGQRIALVEDVVRRSPHFDRPTPPELQARYQRVRGKLIGFLYDRNTVLRAYPEHDRSEAARFARAYAWHRAGDAERALAEVRAVVAERPDDPYARELEGQILLEAGRPAEALPALRLAFAGSRSDPLIGSMLGHALVAAGERSERDRLHAEAEAVLRQSVARDRQNPFAWLQLGLIYEMRGDEARAALATAERMTLTNADPRVAGRAARIALAGLPEGTSDHLRARDIVMVTDQAIEDSRGRRRRPVE